MWTVEWEVSDESGNWIWCGSWSDDISQQLENAYRAGAKAVEFCSYRGLTYEYNL